MKRLVKLFALGLCGILAFVTCSYDYVHTTQYTLKNDTANPITIELYDKGSLEEQFTIEPGTGVVRKLYGDTFRQPFYNGYKLLVISNATKIEYYPLKNMDAYKLTYQTERERHYEYVFTDDFFKENPSVGE